MLGGKLRRLTCSLSKGYSRFSKADLKSTFYKSVHLLFVLFPFWSIDLPFLSAICIFLYKLSNVLSCNINHLLSRTLIGLSHRSIFMLIFPQSLNLLRLIHSCLFHLSSTMPCKSIDTLFVRDLL